MMKQYYGISAYAGLNKDFPRKPFLSQFPETLSAPCTAVLMGCFGKDTRLLRMFHNKFTDRPHAIEWHVSNGASRRSGRLGPGAYGQRYSVRDFNEAWEAGGTPELLRQLDNFIELIMMFNESIGSPANLRTVISPELEDNMTDKAFLKFSRAIRERCTYPLVRSPCTGDNSLGIAKFYEVHGLHYPDYREIGNTDGVSVYFNDGEKLYYLEKCSEASAATYLAESDGLMTMLWSANQQGLGTGKRPPPAHKDRTFIVTPQAIAGMRRLLQGY